MIKRSFDLDLLLRATDLPEIHSTRQDFITWFNMPNNLMFAEGENVGLATFDYPGLYTLHWYFKVKGREAIDLAKRMLANLFENYGAEAVRGLIREDLKAARWACRQVGLKSHGLIEFPNGQKDELFTITKDEFLNSLNKEKENG